MGLVEFCDDSGFNSLSACSSHFAFSPVLHLFYEQLQFLLCCPTLDGDGKLSWNNAVKYFYLGIVKVFQKAPH